MPPVFGCQEGGEAREASAGRGTWGDGAVTSREGVWQCGVAAGQRACCRLAGSSLDAPSAPVTAMPAGRTSRTIHAT